MRYKRRERGGKNLQNSRCVWEDNFGKIPKGLIVHHIDKNKINDDINNLSLMTVTAHNRLHSPDREIWNKGMTIKTSKKWSNAIKKRMQTHNKNHQKTLDRTWNLYLSGMTAREISVEENISRRQVYDRVLNIVS